MVDQMNMKTTQGSIRPLSAAAPITSAGLYISCQRLAHFQGLEAEVNIRDGSEHPLVNGKEQARNSGTSHTRLS